MAIPLDHRQIVSFEELLMSQMVQLEAVTKLLVEKGERDLREGLVHEISDASLN